MKKETEKQVSIRFPLDVIALIEAQAKENKRSFNAQVNWIVQGYLKKQGEKG